MCKAPHDEIEHWAKIVPSGNSMYALTVTYGKHTRYK